MLVDRVEERQALEALLDAVRSGSSRTLVLRGEAGIGKTALLEHAIEQAADMRLARIAGVQSEMELSFAGVHQLLVPFAGGIDRLPAPQREALQVLLGVREGAADRFLVGLATLTLLTDAAMERPVLCVVDDAQWLDGLSIGVLAFVARRLLADHVGMLFAARDGEDERTQLLEGLAVLAVGGLPGEAASELLAASVDRPLDRRVRAWLLGETAGNPLALVELARELTAEELAGAAPLARPMRFGGRLEALYLSRVREMPREAQLLLLVAAADQLGDPDKLERAIKELGLAPELAELAEIERLLTWRPRVQFRHPLMRFAAYYAASPHDRRRAHEALAAASDPSRDPDRRAWHLAEAAVAPDEAVAAELERSADRARSRSGWASGAAFRERAAELTADPRRQAQRRLGAAEARLVAGEAPAAQVLLARAWPYLIHPLDQARARRLEGLAQRAVGALPEATSTLLEAARMLEPHDLRSARDTLADAFAAAQLSGRYGVETGEVLKAVRSTRKMDDSQTTVGDFLLEGFAALSEQRYEAGVEHLRRAIEPLTADQPFPDDALPRFMGMSMAANLLYDDSIWHEVEHRWIAEFRRRGALAALLFALPALAYNQLWEGRLAAAEVNFAEAHALSEAAGYRAHLGGFRCGSLHVLALRGREAETRALARELQDEFSRQGDGSGVNLVLEALAMLEIGLGNYGEALRLALERFDDRSVLSYGASMEVIEAGTRCEDRRAAGEAFERFSPLALASGTNLALGLVARGRALLVDDEQAEAGFVRSVEHLRQCRCARELARSHLVYGEWLRRRRRRRDAREQLRTALDLFERMGMHAFAGRAHAELEATGEHARERNVETQDELTPQESRIAQLAGQGTSNREIGAKLFISSATVDYHLRKVYRKLGITGRVQLARALLDTEDWPGPHPPL